MYPRTRARRCLFVKQQRTFRVTSERAETLITFSPAGTRGAAGFGVDGFFREVAIPAVPGQAPPELSGAD
jgi:hypothetical protein